MFPVQGIGLDAWVKVDADCASSYDIIGENAHLRFGSERGNGLTLVFSEASIDKHITTCAEILRKMRDDDAVR